MLDDPDHYDAKIAGWWVWGCCAWIGSGWCSPKDKPSEKLPMLAHGARGMDASSMSSVKATPSEQMPLLSSKGQGVHAARTTKPSEQLCHLGNAGRGVHRAPTEQLPHLQTGSRGVHRVSLGSDAEIITDNLIATMRALCDRMRRVRVACGDWSRVLTDAVTAGHGLTGILLDPPYAEGTDNLYGNHDKSVSADVRAWAIANGSNPLLRIALCGYEGEHDHATFPDGWQCVAWKAQGGYGSGNGNPHRERIWFSPHCLRPDVRPVQASLFATEAAP